MVQYNMQCVEASKVCNNFRDCDGGEEENDDFCKTYKCPNQNTDFYCPSDKSCLNRNYVCDGITQCLQGEDEKQNCSQFSSELTDKYVIVSNRILIVSSPYYYYNIDIKSCEAKCRSTYTGFDCKGFNFRPSNADRYYSICELLQQNALDSDPPNYMVEATSAHYYPKPCTSDQFKCPNGGLCINASQKCDGRNDCGDRSDEIGCANIPDEDVQLRLAQGPSPYHGRLEVRYQGEWGLVCDDMFTISAGHVVCRELFNTTAKDVIQQSSYMFGRGNGIFLLDNVECTGQEKRLQDCKHLPWRQHNCAASEVLTIECNYERPCTDTEFRCEASGSCIETFRVCDSRNDCADKSDERSCVWGAKLVDGSSATEGRVELSVGSIRGTVCKDRFDNNDAKVICTMLGYGPSSGYAQAVVNGTFGQGSGLVITGSLECSGSESSVSECPNFKHSQTTCSHEDDVGVRCALPNDPDQGEPGGVTTPSTPLQDNCGKRPIMHHFRTRIVNGEDVVKGSFPWQAGIRKWGQHYCGGTILNNEWILSAAHCFVTSSGPASKGIFTVRVGDYDNSRTDENEQEFELDVLKIHDNYNTVTLNFDFALLKIKKKDGRSIEFNPHVQPACFPDIAVLPEVGLNCFVSGWGNTDPARPHYPNILKAIQAPILDTNKCNGPTMYKGAITEQNMFCAGYEQGGIDSCQGDSGGPLVCHLDGKYVIEGVVSWGYGCAQPNQPGVYAKVRNNLAWIRKQMEEYV